jgi:aspartyl/asparaginyl beta-hydroxylase (cupin superfamily)
MLFEKVEEESGRIREYNRKGKLVKVHCTYLWNYHNETPLYYECMLIKIKQQQKYVYMEDELWE